MLPLQLKARLRKQLRIAHRLQGSGLDAERFLDPVRPESRCGGGGRGVEQVPQAAGQPVEGGEGTGDAADATEEAIFVRAMVGARGTASASPPLSCRI
ncbi:hypothetical protein GZL_07932 [Streptomyces sp. 769]|nr:hypothetical protein GZL_07932 [Streptomyces sp. 769]